MRDIGRPEMIRRTRVVAVILFLVVTLVGLQIVPSGGTPAETALDLERLDPRVWANACQILGRLLLILTALLVAFLTRRRAWGVFRRTLVTLVPAMALADLFLWIVR